MSIGQVIKEGDVFLCATSDGSIDDTDGAGLYTRDTRFLSHATMDIGGRTPILLSSSAERAHLAYVDLTNPVLEDGTPSQVLNIRRTRVIDGSLFERLRIKNYGSTVVTTYLRFTFAADFADIFAIRGMFPILEPSTHPKIEGSILEFSAIGPDDVMRRTRIDLGVTPDAVDIDGGRVTVRFDLALDAGETRQFTFSIHPITEAAQPLTETERLTTYDVAVGELRRRMDQWDQSLTQIVTDNELFNTLLHRGVRDLHALITETDDGRYIAAGIPWYVAAFGRDSIITAHQILMLTPEPARDTLRLLARFQGTKEDPWRDEQPGKILHEVRTGALARANEIPHTPYYGSIDATPLFLMLYGTYFKWTNDRALAEELLPAVDAALEWIDRYGDVDGDGFVEYEKLSDGGLDNQGWKDSYDSIVHRDGTLAKGPIALAEVQAYVYLAKHRIAEVFDVLDRRSQAATLRAQATGLRRRFNEAFWMEDERYFAIALDGDKQQVGSITSNPAHGLYCHLIDPEKGAEVAKRLIQPDMFSGWGIRTMSKDADAYNPMSYHNGSVWPHDNALIAAGLKRYGFHKQTNRIATALFDAALSMEYMRLPELFCGFTRRAPNQPVQYPVACSPQAWASGSPFLLLQSMLGLSALAHQNLLTINSPVLPSWLNTVELRNLRVGDSRLSLVFRREGETTSFSMLHKEGSVRVVMEE